ncbi:diguanylate cyclase [Bifidobacterium aemilianum]|uniref:Diguanylate cyclase n=1 Tax=Bifidobacterium aemilianum TaxID=2493120 RepID=A0A366K9M5_9BIFI|nr:tRNA-dihydrouridine synthase [Bifidobacterium aemilianum]RBP97942.1 diguanylate cyclase [Bifidobacterium aemilianum]
MTKPTTPIPSTSSRGAAIGSPDLEPFYNSALSYEDNYALGPFGLFKHALDGTDTESPHQSLTDSQAKQPQGFDRQQPTQAQAQPQSSFLGIPLNLPFGIPAGPLLNAKYTTAAFRMGFDMAVYKTVRSQAWPCNPFPNVLSVHPRSADGSITPGCPELEEGLLADTDYRRPVSISNSFGVPSRDPDIWQPDMQAAMEAAGPGQLLLPSFQGSRWPGMDQEAYIRDHVQTARLVCQTGARIMEMNTSCPNEGHGRLLCHDPQLVGRIAQAVKEEIGDRPLIIKLAYIPSDEALETMVRQTAAQGRVQGFATINTISARLVDAQGRQALPGEGRDHSGVCGDAIRGAGLDMVRRLDAIRRRLGLDFAITGVGGVMGPEDYEAYRQAGADAVMSATGAMWNPLLARQIACQAAPAQG